MVENLLLELGYTNEETKKILNNERLKTFKPETLYNKIKEIYTFFINNNYMKEHVIKMAKNFPAIYSYSMENIEMKNNYLISLGYTKEEMFKLTKNFPSIYGYNAEKINKKINDLIQLGYTKEDVITMGKKFPNIYGLDIEKISKRLDELTQLGYTKEEALMITKNFPTIFGYEFNKISKRIEFYSSIGLRKMTVYDSKQLMQGTELSYARLEFYRQKGIVVNDYDYLKLFMSQKNFEKKYGIGKKELLEMYNYEKQNEKVSKKS